MFNLKNKIINIDIQLRFTQFELIESIMHMNMYSILFIL